MIRQTMRLVALAAAGLVLAGGAWGQVLRQTTSADFLVAHEFFGASGGREVLASKVDLDGTAEGTQAPYVALTVGGTAVAVGNAADVTFTVVGATFSETVSPANLDRRAANCGGERQNNLLVTGPTSGGAKGDSSVTFKVEVTGNELAADQAICFWVPNLQATLTTVSAPGVTPAEMGVNVTASISQGVTNSNPFPAVINGNNVDAGGMPTPDNTTGNPGPITDRTIFKAAPALMTSLGMGGTGYVSLEDRTKVVSGGTPDPSADPAKAAMGVSVGTLSIALSSNAGMIWKLDGSGPVGTASTDSGPVDTLDATLGGQVMLSVGSTAFQEGDKVVFGSGTSARQVAPEGGMASTSVELKPTAGLPIVYVPGGVGILKPSAFAAMAKYSFNSLDNNNNLPIMASVGNIKYAGIEVEAYAYGVVRGGGMDTSYGRATCEAASGMCQLFADCTDQDGAAYFGGPVPIAAGATAVIDSDALAGALGGGWDKGRGRCDIWSTAPLAFQHMVRSHGLLINNSAVVGRSLDEGADTGDAVAAVKMVVDNICGSIPGIQDLDTNMDGDQSTPCRTVADQ